MNNANASLMGKAKLCGAISITGVAVFLAIVGYLHLAQAGYDPGHQLMSELALGAHGEMMLFAFLAVAFALFALAIGVSVKGAQLALIAVLVFAALCFIGAGVFPLGATTDVHIALVALAFIASGLAMYLLPSNVPVFSTRFYRVISWGFLAALALSVVLGQSVVPMGIGQQPGCRLTSRVDHHFRLEVGARMSNIDPCPRGGLWPAIGQFRPFDRALQFDD